MSGPKQKDEFPLIAFMIVLALAAALLFADLESDTVPNTEYPTETGGP